MRYILREYSRGDNKNIHKIQNRTVFHICLTSSFILCRFIIKDRETFFTAAQRSQVVWQIMMRAKYDDSEKVRCKILTYVHNTTMKCFYKLKSISDNFHLHVNATAPSSQG